MRRVILDTNVYVAFMNTGAFESVVLGPGLVRHMSSVVLMELEVGATTPVARRALSGITRVFERAGRLLTPSRAAWRESGRALRELKARGREIRRASLVNDVLIALTAREIGAAVMTQDASDFRAIHGVLDFDLEPV